MEVGISYDLKSDYSKDGVPDEQIAELDQEETIESIEKTLNQLGFTTSRIGNIYNLTRLLSMGKKWDIVFNIAEGLFGFGREAQIPALLDAYQIPYVFSDPLTLSVCLYKPMAKDIIANNSIKTPPYAIIKSISDVENLKLPFPVFLKPIAGGTSIGVDLQSKCLNYNDIRTKTEAILRKFNQPLIAEPFLPGREFTVGIIGNGNTAKVIGIMEILIRSEADQEIYTYSNKELFEDRITYKPLEYGKLYDSISEIATKSYKVLECKDAGRVDIRIDSNGIPNFLEINPLAGLHPRHSDLPILATLFQIPYLSLIDSIMKAALSRINIVEKVC